MSESSDVSIRVVESKSDFLRSDLLSQVQKIERKVFPKHEAMTETFEKELKKENTHIAIATSYPSRVGGGGGGGGGGEGGQAAPREEGSQKKGTEAAKGVLVVGYILFVRSRGGGQITNGSSCISRLVAIVSGMGMGSALLDLALQHIYHGPKPSKPPGKEANRKTKRCVAGDTIHPEEGGGKTSCLAAGSPRTGLLICDPSKEVTLQVDPSREEAVRLYRSRGFREVSVLRGYYCEERDAVLMRLDPSIS